MTALAWIAAAWLAWCAAHLAAMAMTKFDAPFYNGFRVHIPERYAEVLTANEWVAVYLHECGHRDRMHVWQNYALVCLFLRAGPALRLRQELEADDFAASLGYAKPLADALRKIANHRTDYQRADRLDPQTSN